MGNVPATPAAGRGTGRKDRGLSALWGILARLGGRNTGADLVRNILRPHGYLPCRMVIKGKSPTTMRTTSPINNITTDNINATNISINNLTTTNP